MPPLAPSVVSPPDHAHAHDGSEALDIDPGGYGADVGNGALAQDSLRVKRLRNAEVYLASHVLELRGGSGHGFLVGEECDLDGRHALLPAAVGHVVLDLR